MSTQPKKLKAAVVGCGGAGIGNHIPWYATNPKVELVGLVDINKQQAQGCSERWGGRVYSDIGEMLDKEKPHLVSIATPVHLHREQAIECLKYGCHVLCEKPMAPTLEEAQEMIDTAKDNKVILGIVFDKRFSLVYEKGRQLILSGEIGVPLFMRVNWVTNVSWSGFRTKLYTGGGVFQDVGSHFIDLFRWYFNTEITTINGVIDIFYPEEREVEDHATALLQLKNGMSGIIETSWIGPKDYRYSHIGEVWVYCTEGAVKALDSFRVELPGIDIWSKKQNEWRIISLPSNVATFEHYQYKRMIDEFVACVDKEKEFVPSGEDGKRAVEAVLGLYQSWYTNKKIDLPLSQSPNLSEIFTSLRKKKPSHSCTEKHKR